MEGHSPKLDFGEGIIVVFKYLREGDMHWENRLKNLSREKKWESGGYLQEIFASHTLQTVGKHRKHFLSIFI